MEGYDHRKIEKKWQEKWEHEKAFQAKDDTSKEKEYVLIEFPYPSGDGLHVGHIRSWTALDIVARKRRLEGKNVLYPIGWDAFGLPTENYAIKTGKDPRVVTKENTDIFRRQIKSLGLSFDWSREINTSDPTYYKWTQWIFLQLYKHGLAYKAKTLINWCPKDKIGLANEEVIDGACERCGTLVQKREKEQWMLAITKYAKRLYEDLDSVNYIEQAKIQQRNWIGPSEGAQIAFPVLGSDKKIEVFTTRPDTLYGATYVVLAPEHPLVLELAPLTKNKGAIETYVKATRQTSEIERTAEAREKTGILMEGICAINPGTKEAVAIFVADYVLGSYATGAIMGVPHHDERDFEFAKSKGLPIKEVIEALVVREQGEDAVKKDMPFTERRAVVAVIKHPSKDKYLGVRWKRTGWQGFVIGGIEEGEEAQEAAKREVREETGYKNIRAVGILGGPIHAQFYQTLKAENRFAHFQLVLVELGDEEKTEIAPEEKVLHEFLWLSPEKMTAFITHRDMQILWDRVIGKICYSGTGILVNSGQFSGLQSEEAKKKITEFVGGVWLTVFKLRDWVFSRQRYWGEPIPMILCKKCGWVPVPEDELPVILPEVTHYQPTDTGESPLATISHWIHTTCPSCGGEATRESDVMPNWAGSSWYYLRYCDPKNTKEFASPEHLKYWTPVDWYNGGMEHTTLHLLYSRFWHKFLYDLALVPTSEPYAKRTSHGLILAKGGEKMSKSKGNVINPDGLIERFGADSLRLYEMFIGPFDQPVIWSDTNIIGTRRFVERAWRLISTFTQHQKTVMSPEAVRMMSHSIAKISSDIESLKMNTAVSQLMILLNHLESTTPTMQALETFLRLLSPFAPHVAGELWEKMGTTTAMEKAGWPTTPKESATELEVALVALQINGKVRATIELPLKASEREALEKARLHPAISPRLARGKEVRAVYVPGRVINFVVSDVA